MPKAIRIHKPGGPEALRWEDIPVGDPGANQVRIRHTAIGLNFIDIYHRTGLYPVPELPFTPGIEAVGIVEAIGSEVWAQIPQMKIGDRVAYATPPVGAYAEVRLIDADRLVPIPDEIDDRTAAALLLKGMTAQYLLRQTYSVRAGDAVLIHAAAGGVGLMVSQWAAHLGALVIGTVSSEEKAELATTHGCHHAIRYNREDFVARVKEITEGKGVHVVYDSVGKDTFIGSLDCLRPRGIMVSFGQSSGSIPPFDIAGLSARGSLFLTRPSLMDYTNTRGTLIPTARETFDAVKNGIMRVNIHQEFPLQAAADAHAALESRKTAGSTILIP
uniref:NADPH:quinone reductase n=1 Tax=Candidatus Kentrum sp. TUN TaxID=2126343 RepID=A0A451AMF0_9GAMM|nr:MAG: NADPH2:quinone reductase [Candidatus Kentron sp. TUN]VFK63348.1 MAG: NADPH2:quinone reductase [Candidatus Kentron sp. TUN]VFK67213.1 MAG: NADPH2:quinone reductase [Candidatus Kentron sp. TUN]